MGHGLQTKRLPVVVREVNVSSDISEQCRSTPFTQPANVSYLTCLCNISLAFLVFFNVTEKNCLLCCIQIWHLSITVKFWAQAFEWIFIVNCTIIKSHTVVDVHTYKWWCEYLTAESECLQSFAKICGLKVISSLLAHHWGLLDIRCCIIATDCLLFFSI